MVQIVVKSNVREFRRFLKRYQRRELPFALSQALTATAFDVRRQVVEKTFPGAFELRNKGFARGIMRVDKARKRDPNAQVYDRRELPYLVMQETGGIKRPRSGSHIAVPQQARRGARGVVKRDRPRVVLASPKGFKTPNAIFRRKGRGGKILELLHLLVSQARIRPRLPFGRDAERVALRRFDRHLQRSLIKALRTAR